MSNPYKNVDLKKLFESLTDSEIAEIHRVQEEENQKAYDSFVAAMKQDKCFLCNLNLEDFDENIFCYHWFLYPKNIRKKHFDRFLKNEALGYFHLDSYFRWVANYEKPIRNINDLRYEMPSNQLISYTAKYKNIEWSISVGHSDKDGHPNTNYGTDPHFHLQMKVDGLPFIKFNDYHLKFNDEDLWTLEYIRQNEGNVAIGYDKGRGMNIIEFEDNIEIIADHMTLVDDESKATFKTHTLIKSKDGQEIDMELFSELVKESKETNKPIGQLVKKRMPNLNVTTIVEPGEGVPALKKRKRRGWSQS
ncbi:MAG TPA: hypothetical protein PKW76_15485 [bacterium]|nr:hypothetical protein [bacterium]HPG47078.1 hypothetical protein [bacterium]HPM99334.1 hypothetical protein [bacterium]